MENMDINHLEVAPTSVVIQSAREFAAALTETPQFLSFEQASEELQADREAQAAISAFQNKQNALRGEIMLNAVSQEDQVELERLRNGFISHPSVLQYNKARAELVTLCQTSADQFSQSIGFDFAASCRSGGCCG